MSILLHVALLVAFVSLTGLVLLVLFEPGLAYRVVGREDARSARPLSGGCIELRFRRKINAKYLTPGTRPVLTLGIDTGRKYDLAD